MRVRCGCPPRCCVSLGHCLLHRDRAAHRIDDAGKLHQQAVAGGLDDAAVVLGDLRIEELAAQRLEAFERPFLVRPHQPRIPRHIGGQDRGETAALWSSFWQPGAPQANCHRLLVERPVLLITGVGVSAEPCQRVNFGLELDGLSQTGSRLFEITP